MSKIVQCELPSFIPRSFTGAGVDIVSEYLSPTGWKSVGEYSVGDKLMQYDPHTGVGNFVFPLRYTVQNCTNMIKLKTKYGVDCLVSPEYRVRHKYLNAEELEYQR